MRGAALAVVTVLAALSGACDALVGVPGSVTEDTPVDAAKGMRDAGSAKDTGVARDAAKDRNAADVAKPETAAVLVSSATAVQDWCVVTVAGDVECWGINQHGQLGNGTMMPSTAPAGKVIGLPGPASDVSLGYYTPCALLRSGAVWCWGDGTLGALGNGTTVAAQATPVPVTGLGAGVVSVSAGLDYSCAVKDDGSVWCWGQPFSPEALFSAPKQFISSATPAASVSVGGTSACALMQDGGLACWGGYSAEGLLGNGSTGGSPTPVGVTGLSSGVKAVSVGDTFACALTEAGAVLCWGEGQLGTLGNGQLANSPVPVQVKDLSSGVTAVVAGYQNVCVLKDDGSVFCWGLEDQGALGNPTVATTPTFRGGLSVAGAPVPVEGLSSKAAAISVGSAPCVVTTGGGVECWGLTCEDAPTPVPVATNNTTGALSVWVGGFGDSESFACALITPGTSNKVGAQCWGANSDGQLGSGSTLSSSAPVETSALAMTAISVGSGQVACGIQSGQAVCWGDNSMGQLGSSATQSQTNPTRVQGLTGTPAIVAAGGIFACAVTTGEGGGVYCWGDNGSGELGDGSSVASSSTPVAVTGLGSGDVTALALGYDFACALLAGGTVDCWGDNALGELGNGTEDNASSPTPVAGLTGVASIAAGPDTLCAIVSGALECWGYNGAGQINFSSLDGSTESTTVLVPTPGFVTSGATAVAIGQQSACAIVNGAAECWGCAALGNGTYYGDGLGCEEVVPVTGLQSDVTAIAVGWSSACAVVSGVVNCWGFNSSGQLGNSGPVNDLVATVIPGFP